MKVLGFTLPSFTGEGIFWGKMNEGRQLPLPPPLPRPDPDPDPDPDPVPTPAPPCPCPCPHSRPCPHPCPCPCPHRIFSPPLPPISPLPFLLCAFRQWSDAPQSTFEHCGGQASTGEE